MSEEVMIKEGYKDSPLGEIPESWEVVNLYDLRNTKDRHSFTGGPFGSDLKSEHYTDSGIRIIQLQNIGEGKFINKEKVYTSEDKANQLKSCNIFPNEIILAKMAPVGRCCKVPNTDERYLMCSDGIRLSINKSKFNNEFIFQSLNFKPFRDLVESKSTGTTRSRIGLSDLKEIPIRIPPLPEQQKIAEILSTVDDKIEVIDEQIQQTQQLKKGLMQHLLTKGIGHTRFKDSPLGEIPESWEVVRFDKVADNTTERYEGNNGKCIELEHIEQSTGRLLGFDDVSGKSSNKYHFRINDILFGKLRPYLKKFWRCEFEGACTTELMVIRPKNITSSQILFYIVQQDKFIENSVSKSFGTKMPRTSWKILSEFELGLPPLPEQQKIAEILSSTDDKIESLQEKKVTYQELKKGLMQKLLTGKIRVKI